jgi:hypothetical protein
MSLPNLPSINRIGALSLAYPPCARSSARVTTDYFPLAASERSMPEAVGELPPTGQRYYVAPDPR